MKKVLGFLALAIVVFACGSSQESTQADKSYATYGEEITPEDVVTLAGLKESIKDQDSLVIKVKAVIEQTCAKKGCWMIIEDEEGNSLRVTFKDYGFFVPTEGAEGKEVIIAGYAKRSVTDVELLKHFAEDAGKSQEEIDAITEPKEEVSFVATGVIIYEKDTQSEE